MAFEKNFDIVKTLSEETRYKIVEVLLDEERCACKIPELIERTQSNTSMHLTKLSDLGILKSRRTGKNNIYSIKNATMLNRLKQIMEKK